MGPSGDHKSGITARIWSGHPGKIAELPEIVQISPYIFQIDFRPMEAKLLHKPHGEGVSDVDVAAPG